MTPALHRADVWRSWMLCRLLMAIDEGADMDVKVERLLALRDADLARDQALRDWVPEGKGNSNGK